MKRQTLVEYKDASPEIQAIYDEVTHSGQCSDIPSWKAMFLLYLNS